MQAKLWADKRPDFPSALALLMKLPYLLFSKSYKPATLAENLHLLMHQHTEFPDSNFFAILCCEMQSKALHSMYVFFNRIRNLYLLLRTSATTCFSAAFPLSFFLFFFLPGPIFLLFLLSLLIQLVSLTTLPVHKGFVLKSNAQFPPVKYSRSPNHQ